MVKKKFIKLVRFATTITSAATADFSTNKIMFYYLFAPKKSEQVKRYDINEWVKREIALGGNKKEKPNSLTMS